MGMGRTVGVASVGNTGGLGSVYEIDPGVLIYKHASVVSLGTLGSKVTLSSQIVSNVNV